MTDLDQSIRQLFASWDPAAARITIKALAMSAWESGRPDAQTLARAEELRRLLQCRLARATTEQERFGLLNLCYTLEQGMCRRNEALDLARQVVKLAERAATPKERVAAGFQMAKALLYIDQNAEAIRWTLDGIRLGDQLEREGTADDELRRLLAEQEGRLVNRMATLGGMEDEVDRAAESTVRRWQALHDPMGLVGSLGMIAEGRMFQGRWQESANAARMALSTVGYPEKLDKATWIIYALWAGARAVGRLGDTQTALKWAEDADRFSQQSGNIEAVYEARIVHASTLAMIGRFDEAVAEMEGVAKDTPALNSGDMTHWTLLERAWVRMKAGLPVNPDDLMQGHEAFTHMNYHLVATEMLYALSHALRRAGQDGQKEREQACKRFEQLKMHWHLEMARKDALL